MAPVQRGWTGGGPAGTTTGAGRRSTASPPGSPLRRAGDRPCEDVVQDAGRGRYIELRVVDDGEPRAVPAGHPAVDAGDFLVGEAAVSGALGVALQDYLQARQQDDGQQARPDVPLPAAEADDRTVREDGVVEDAGDAVGQEVPCGESAGTAGQAVLRLRMVVPPRLRVGETRAHPFAYVVEADVGGGDPAVIGPVLGDAGLPGARGADEQHGERGGREVGL